LLGVLTSGLAARVARPRQFKTKRDNVDVPRAILPKGTSRKIRQRVLQ